MRPAHHRGRPRQGHEGVGSNLHGRTLRRRLLADFYTYFSFGLACGVNQKIFNRDLLEGHDKIRAVMARMAEHPSVAQVEAEKAS